MSKHVSLLVPFVVCALTACSGGDDGPTTTAKGNAQVFVVPEESITDGLEPGDGDEQIQDGWKVEYTKFLVTIGNFRARSTATGKELRDPTVYVLDLKNAPAAGYVTASFDAIDAVRFDKVGEDMPAAAPGAKALAPTSDADLKLMVDNGYSLYVAGSMTKDAKTITFAWGFAMGTSFDDCASAQGDTGFAVPQGGTVQIKPTIHGDHWFFSDITEGAEVTKRYAQFIADADADGNGEVTIDELKALKAADAFPTDKYKLSGGLDGPIATAWDYVKAQARTIHDFQGDGECPTRAVLK